MTGATLDTTGCRSEWKCKYSLQQSSRYNSHRLCHLAADGATRGWRMRNFCWQSLMRYPNLKMYSRRKFKLQKGIFTIDYLWGLCGSETCEKNNVCNISDWEKYTSVILVVNLTTNGNDDERMTNIYLIPTSLGNRQKGDFYWPIGVKLGKWTFTEAFSAFCIGHLPLELCGTESG